MTAAAIALTIVAGLLSWWAWPQGVQWKLAAVALALMLCSVAFAATAALEVGQLVTFSDAGGRDRICARVASLDSAPGGPAVWLVGTGAAPLRVVRVQLVDVRPGCDRA